MGIKNFFKKKKKKKGFTLIELLAVIIILGILMIIAIPSVSNYIIDSRKDALGTTINNYISNIISDVNSLKYGFMEMDTIYAVPIECIALEKGGDDPFGEWHQANDKYWAYILVQYTGDRYIYGFTFKDEAGYGLYPSSQQKLTPKKDYLKQNLDLNRPKTGALINVAPQEHWDNSGFEINDNTTIKVLIAESAGVQGDGINTCTLKRKGSNYEEVEEEKEQIKEEQEKEELLKVAYALILDNSQDSNNSKPMIFVRSKEEIKVGETYNSLKYGPRIVSAVYTGFDTERYTVNSSNKSNAPWVAQASNVTSIFFEHKIKPVSTSGWFTNFTNVSKIDVTNLDMSLVDDMSYMFYNVGSKNTIKEISLIGLNTFDTSKVTKMIGVFAQFGRYLTNWSIQNISNWDVTSVVTTEGMFAGAGLNAGNFSLNLSGWDVSNIQDMSFMLAEAGKGSASLNVSGLENWKPISATNMSFMFYSMGKNAPYTINISNWNVDNVTNHDSINDYVTSKVILPTFK